MALKDESEGLDRAAKIKLAVSVGAIVIAFGVLAIYFLDVPIFGSAVKPPPPVTPAQQEEKKAIIEGVKKRQEEVIRINPKAVKGDS